MKYLLCDNGMKRNDDYINKILMRPWLVLKACGEINVMPSEALTVNLSRE